MDDLYLPPAATPEQASHGSKRMDPMRVACSPIDPSNNSPHLVAWSSCHFKRRDEPNPRENLANKLCAGPDSRVEFSHTSSFFFVMRCAVFFSTLLW
jgi:hypothetical protein